jgi:hypothetical protein
VTYELARALLFTEAVDSPALGGALLHAARDRSSLVRALATHELLPAEELDAELGGAGRKGDEALSPSRRLMASLPAGLCARLVAVPLLDLGNVIEVAVADVRDRHVAEELSYWLGKEVRLVAASIWAIDEAIASLRPGSKRPSAPVPANLRADRGERFEGTPRGAPSSDRRLRYSQAPPTLPTIPQFPHAPDFEEIARVEPPEPRPTSQTPAWGTVVELAVSAGAVMSDPPSALDLADERDGRHPGEADDERAIESEGAALRRAMHLPPAAPVPRFSSRPPATPPMRFPSSIPPPMPSASHAALRSASAGGKSNPPPPTAPLEPVDAHDSLTRLREAMDREALVDALVRAAGVVARRVAIFAVRRSGFAGWSCSRGFAERDRLRELTLPLGAPSVLALATAAGSYFGPILPNDAHARLMAVMEHATRDVAVLAIKAQGRAALVLLADELDDSMLGTRYLDQVARAAGEALSRILHAASLAPPARS